MEEESRSNSNEGIKITYLLGAGASYNSVPIWNKQALSMEWVAEFIESRIKYIQYQADAEQRHKELVENNIINDIVFNLKKYSKKAQEFGTLDIYARNLYLLENFEELNYLKYHLSIYFDIWEHFVGDRNLLTDTVKYSKIDKRYYSLLSVLLDRGKNHPEVKKDVSFLSWNYDLQLEMAYKSFMRDSEKQTIENVNESLPFFEEEEKRKIIHLNGFRGAFKYDDTIYSNVDKEYWGCLEDYLLGILRNKDDFNSSGVNRFNIDYQNNIKYAWEENSKTRQESIEILKSTDILIIIGYSFPSYNREIDSELLKAFEESSSGKEKKIVYQNPTDNTELLESILKYSKPEHYKNVSQFYIPQDFLFRIEKKEITFG